MLQKKNVDKFTKAVENAKVPEADSAKRDLNLASDALIAATAHLTEIRKLIPVLETALAKATLAYAAAAKKAKRSQTESKSAKWKADAAKSSTLRALKDYENALPKNASLFASVATSAQFSPLSVFAALAVAGSAVAGVVVALRARQAPRETPEEMPLI